MNISSCEQRNKRRARGEWEGRGCAAHTDWKRGVPRVGKGGASYLIGLKSPHPLLPQHDLPAKGREGVGRGGRLGAGDAVTPPVLLTATAPPF